MATGEPLTKCWLVFPNTTTVYLPQENVEYAVDYWGNGLSAGMCGFHTKELSVTATGFWSLRAQGPQDQMYNSRISVKVHEYPNMSDQEEHLYLNPDGSFSGTSIDLVPNDFQSNNVTAVYCIIHAPGDHLTSGFSHNGCSVYIGKQAKAYAGQWTSQLGIEGLTEELIYSVNITLSEPHLRSGWELLSFNDGVIDMFCDLEGALEHEELEYCYFTRPGDKKQLHSSNNVGNGDYFNYISKFSCHLMIMNASSLDYGLWSCVMKTNVYLHASTVFLPASQSAEEEGLFVDIKKEVVVGLPTFILCNSPYPLSSCFISSPNDEVFSGKKSRFEFGECMLNIPTVQLTHNGTWKCHMSTETEINVATMELVVWEKNFIAVTPLVRAVYGETTSISCRTVLTSRKTAPSLANCWFIRPDGTTITPQHNASIPNGMYYYYGQGLHNGECGLKINATSKTDEGKWFCIGQLHGSLTESHAEVIVNTCESTKIPSNEISVLEEEEIYFKLNVAANSNFSCLATTPDGTTADLLNSSSPGLIYWRLHAYSRECGVNIDKGFISDRDSPLEQSNKIYVKIGAEVDLDCSEIGALYCTFVHPNSDEVLLGPGPCTITLTHVTDADVGVWTCYVGTNNMSMEFKKTIELILEGNGESVGWKRSNWQEGAVDLFCNVKRSLEYCRFVKPSGESFRTVEGLGRNGLTYYGNGLQSGDCGITVSDMSEEDYGTWKCILGVSEDGTIETETRLINIHGTTKGEMKQFVTERVKEIVLVGSELFVSCQAEYKLSYCWIKHPNGTRVNANTDLLSGSCIAVTIAYLEDAGTWECHLGLSNEEKVVYVDVTVTGSSVYADKAVAVSGDSRSFTCHSVPTGCRLKYCRFIRPDGKGFRLTEESIYEHYSYNGAGLQYGDCGLKISKLGQEDIGQWICAALIFGERIEGSDSVIISQEDSSQSLGVIIGTTVAVLLFVIGVVIFGVWYLRKKKRAQQQTDSIDAISNTSSQEEITSP